MTYAGTTSTAPNFPYLAGQGIVGTRVWEYNSTHLSTDLETAGFISDGAKLGMKVGDWLVSHSHSSWPLAATAPSTGVDTLHKVAQIGSNSTVLLSVGTTLAVGSTIA